MRTIQTWYTKSHPKMLNTLTPRLQRDLLKFGDPNPPISHDLIPSIYYWGAVGTGKTVRAAQLLMEEAKRVYLNGNTDVSYLDCKFISVPTLFSQLKASFSKDSQFEEIMNIYQTCHFLVLDDIGAEKSSDWSLQQLYLIINSRYEYMRTTIITSNKSLEELAVLFGDDRIPSRIQRMAEIWEKVKRW